MLVAHMTKPDQTDSVLVILEPGNLAKLKTGQPMIINLNQYLPGLNGRVEVLLGYTPDIEFVSNCVQAAGGALAALGEAIAESLSRPEIIRPSQLTEAVVQTPLDGEPQTGRME